jgi:hypothetical protein
MTTPTQPAIADLVGLTTRGSSTPAAPHPRPVATPPPAAEIDRGELCAPAFCVRVVSGALGEIADFIQRGLEQAGAAECGDRPCGLGRASEVCRRHRALGLTTCAAGQCAVALDRRAA